LRFGFATHEVSVENRKPLGPAAMPAQCFPQIPIMPDLNQMPIKAILTAVIDSIAPLYKIQQSIQNLIKNTKAFIRFFRQGKTL
jgi:hypothetical protein